VNSQTTAAERLGQFVSTTGWAKIPPGVQHEAKRALLNIAGCAAGAAGDEAVAMAVQTLSPYSGPAACTLIGRRERVDAPTAAFINAVSGNLFDFDDTHFETGIHPSTTVAAAALALAEERGSSGAEVLRAIVLGVEVCCRIGAAVSPGHYRRGWHISATCGVFGAAAAGAALLGLDEVQASAALGLAASQSSGVVENLATAGKNLGVGNAARNGLLSAHLAQAGYTASPTAVEGAFGWARVMGDEFDLARLERGLGEAWEIRANAYKPYPCGYVLHGEIDACLQLRERVRADAIEAVTVRGNQLLLDRADRQVFSARDARVSLQHAAAVALLRGRAAPEDFEDSAVSDAGLARLRAKVTAEIAPGMPDSAAEVAVRMADGSTITAQVVHPRGSLESPLSDEDLTAKFRANLVGVRLGAPAEDLVIQLWRLDEASAAGAVIARLGQTD
jgi:2-methylcitrate dehydratase PrpD